MPEQTIEKLKKSILPQWKVCFIWALAMGLVAHLYKITNWLPNWDGLVFRYDAQNMISIGRWFLPVVCAPSSFYDLPFLTGLMAIIFHGLGAVCICKMFDVKKNVTAAMIGALVGTFPTVTSVMMYSYVADGYAVAFLFSSIAAMCITKDKPCYLGSVLLIALSAGIYQAYITVTIMLLFLSLILELLYKETDLKTVFLHAGKYLLTGATGMVLYYLLLTLLLKLTGTTLLEYQGINEVATFQGIDIPGSLHIIKESLMGYFFDFSKGVTVFVLINCLVLALSICFYLADMVKNRLGLAKIGTLCLCLALMPIGACVLALINSSIDYHNLMKMGFLVFYLFLVLQYERADRNCDKYNVIKSWAILGIFLVLVFQQIVIANVSYHKLNMAYEKSYGVLMRIADRIEQTEGAEDCERILVLGHLPDSEDYSTTLPPEMTGTTNGFIIRADDEVVGQSVFCSAINDYCGKEYRFVSGEEKAELMKKLDATSLCWPSQDSVFVVDDVIVVKLSNEGETV